MCAEHNDTSIHCTTDTRTYHKLNATAVNDNGLQFFQVQTRPVSYCVARGKWSPPKSR